MKLINISSPLTKVSKFLSLLKLTVFLLLTSNILTACIFFGDDDDGGGNNQGSSPIIEYGLLNHGIIDGIKFETNTLTGDTTSAGRFKYRDGETITFKVGDIELASIPVHANLTLLDFDPDYNRNGDSYVPSDRVINILQFLHTISDTNNRDIRITEEIHAAAEGQVINFDQSNAAFVSDPNVLDVIDRITTARQDGARNLLDSVSVQIYLTENLTFRYGSLIDWNDYLDLTHGNQWIYERTTIENNGSPQVDAVSSFLLRSAWKNQKVWMLGWSDNWKPGQFGYIAEYYFDAGLVPPDTQDLPGTENILGTSSDIFYYMFVPEKWLYYSTSINGEVIPVNIKVERLNNIEISGTVYADILKQSLSFPQTNTLTERWYAANTGMLKEVLTTSTMQQTAELTSLELHENFPNNDTVDIFLGLHYFYDFIIKGNNEVFSKLSDANTTVLGYYALIGEIGSPDHIDAFHAMYEIILGDHAVNLYNEVTDLYNTYGLDSETTGNLINFHYNEAVLYIKAFATVFNFDSPELRQAVETNIQTIYQTTIDQLVNDGIMQTYQLYIYSDL